MIPALLLAVALAQGPDQQEKNLEAFDIAWRKAVACLRDTAQRGEAVHYFREAARALERNRRTYGETIYTALWLGYSYHAAGDLPYALAAYRHGLTLDPGYLGEVPARLRTALARAREEVQYPLAAVLLRPKHEVWPPWLTLRSLGLYAFAIYCLACVGFTRWLMFRRRRWAVIAAMSLGLAAVPALGSGIEWWRARRDAAEPVVVVSRDLPLRAGNGVDYPPKVDLPRGCEVRRLFERGGWLQVETGGGLVGWLPADAVVD